MFDLETSISEWCTHLQQQGLYDDDDLLELEDHVYSEVEHLCRIGLSEQEAFWVALHRMGDPNHLVREYGEVRVIPMWKHRLFWMAVGILAFSVFTYLSAFLSDLAAIMAAYFGLGQYLGSFGVTAKLLTFGGSLVCIYSLVMPGKFGQLPYFSRLRVSRIGRRLLYASPLIMVIALKALSYLSLPLLNRYVSTESLSRLMLMKTASDLIFGYGFLILLLWIIGMWRHFRFNELRTEGVGL
jgi:hypothetical protein